MKGVLNIEFILSVIVFMSVISFVSMIIISNIPFLHQESLSENLKSRVYQISHLLLFDEGWSANGDSNWNRNNVVKLGLSSGEPYKLDMDKINELNAMCSGDYNRVRELLADQQTYVELSISYLDGSQLLDCQSRREGLEFVIRRFAVVTGPIGDGIVRFDIKLIGI